MNYLKFPLNYQNSWSIAIVNLDGVESDVFLLDSANLSNFERGAEFRYTGGHYKQSPVRLRVPASGTWTVIVVPGLGGSVNASVEVVGAA
jgi:hypothetical protein